MIRAAFLLLVLSSAPALAAGSTEAEDSPAVPDIATTAPSPVVDPNRFGGPPADPAYGAYQRGLYLTALNLARPRAEAGDGAAQTLMAEILSRGLGVPRNETEAAIQDPPSTGHFGSVESPSLMLMLSSGSPRRSAATCAMMV